MMGDEKFGAIKSRPFSTMDVVDTFPLLALNWIILSQLIFTSKEKCSRLLGS